MNPAPLHVLAALPGVDEAADNARTCVDQLLWNRQLAARGTQLAAQVSRRDAQASAALDGIDISLPAWASGDAFDDTPLGHAAAGVWRLEQSLRELVGVWATAPAQALARMHALVAADSMPVAQLGRPRGDDNFDDPLKIKAVVPHDAVARRLNLMTKQITKTSGVPAVVEAAYVHGELLAIRPFAWGNAPIARAAMRLVMAHRGLDPDLLVMTDVGFQNLGRPAYVEAIRRYSSDPEAGMARWLRHCADAIGLGAGESVAALASIG